MAARALDSSMLPLHRAADLWELTKTCSPPVWVSEVQNHNISDEIHRLKSSVATGILYIILATEKN